MRTVSTREANKVFSKLLSQVEAGEEVVITRRGKAVVELRPAAAQRWSRHEADAWLDARTRARPGVGLTSVEILDLLYEKPEG